MPWVDEDRAGALLEELGFEEFRPGQREGVEAALSGRDSLIVMPTGGGKSLCYQLPGLATEDLTIVVSPLIALINDQWQRLASDGHPVAMITSGMSDRAVADSLAQVRHGDARMIYCSPERFGSDRFLSALDHRNVDLLTVDEAHCVSEWGHDFRPDYLLLPEIARLLGRPTLMACTATATTEVATDIAARFDMEDPIQVRSGFDRPNITFDVVQIDGKGSKARRMDLLERGLLDEGNLPAIVYCGTRRDTDELATELKAQGFFATAYHAGMTGPDRDEAQDQFMSEAVDVVVATAAFGMGVDKANVRSVWHMTIPTSIEAYYQEAGRAGRDGLPAKAILLASRSDLGRLVRFNRQRSSGGVDMAIARERGWRAYRAIKGFVYSNSCRRRRLLDHFSDRKKSEPLGRCCDVCEPEDWLAVPPPLTTRNRRRGKARHGSDPLPDLSPDDLPLLEKLKSWRSELTGGKQVYRVARNSTLEEIAVLRPASADRLEEVKGVGPSFIEKYGQDVLRIVEESSAGDRAMS